MAERAGETSRENPWPVRALSRRMAEYIARSPAAWIEGQLAQVSVRPGAATAFLTLRDPAADMSLSVSCSASILNALARPLREGDRIVVYGKFEFYPARGSLSLRVTELHPVGLGELLARLQRIRELLAAEGLTAASRKKTLPFLPRAIGLITGRAGAAESDVLVNARARWPAVEFRIENVAVQGVNAVQQMVLALRRLDADPHVDVIVLARGGGSVEDLLPFSDETLCRAVARARRRWSPRWGTSPTTRSSTTSPTCGAPPRPTPASGSSPTSGPSCASSSNCMPGPAAACRTGSHTSRRGSPGCARGRCWPIHTRRSWRVNRTWNAPGPAPAT